MLTIAAFYFGMILTFGGDKIQASAMLDLTLMYTGGNHYASGAINYCGLAVPQFIWLSDSAFCKTKGFLEHELGHTNQINELGPITWAVAYALTGGQPFEDYRVSDAFKPPKRFAPRCPLLSLDFSLMAVFVWRCGK